MTILLDAPTVTDWISAIAALIGVPLALWSFIKLIVRDKEREKQIESLTVIASQMHEQVQQLEIQSNEFKNQTYLLLDHNKLVERQLELQSEALYNNVQIESKKAAFEKQKRLSEIRPIFQYIGGSQIGGEFVVDLINKGKDACNIQVTVESVVSLTNIQYNRAVDAQCKLHIHMYKKHTDDLEYAVENLTTHLIIVIFEDIDGDRYRQSFDFRNNTLDASTPELIE